MGDKATSVKDFFPIIFQSLWFGFIKIDGFDKFIVSINTFVEFLSWDSFWNFVHQRDSSDFVLLLDGINLHLHLLVHFCFLLFNVVDTSPREFFFFINFLDFSKELFQEDSVTINLLFGFVIKISVFNFVLFFSLELFVWDFFFWGFLILFNLLIVFFTTHFVCWKVIFYNITTICRFNYCLFIYLFWFNIL